jgi:hypothetical protein
MSRARDFSHDVLLMWFQLIDESVYVFIRDWERFLFF